MAMMTVDDAWKRFALPLEKRLAQLQGYIPRRTMTRVLDRAKRQGYAIRSPKK